MTWAEFATDAGQLGFLIALTAFIYRMFRLWFPDVPEVIMQFVAIILSTSLALIVDFNPLTVGLAATERTKWIVLAVAKGLYRSQNIIKSIDWVSSAATKTGAPDIGISEKPPQWYVDLHPELFPKVPAVEKAPIIARTLAEVTQKAAEQADKDTKDKEVPVVKPDIVEDVR